MILINGMVNHKFKTNSYGGKSIVRRSAVAAIYLNCVRHLPEQTALPSLPFNYRNGPFKFNDELVIEI